MRYMMMIYGAEDAWTDDERRACMADSMVVCDELAARGVFLGASPLQSVTTAATVRVRDGQPLVTDGPFAETTEALGGFYLILAEDRETALRFAAEHPGARAGAVEVRPLFDMSSLKESRT